MNILCFKIFVGASVFIINAKALPDKITLIYIIQVREIPVGDRLTSTITFTNPTNHLVSEI